MNWGVEPSQSPQNSITSVGSETTATRVQFN